MAHAENYNSKVLRPIEGSSSRSDSLNLLKIHYIDVGQGDGILIQTPMGKNIMIDTGTTESRHRVVLYLKNLGIKKIDILVGTHPHWDHIGGMADIINMFQIGKVYMPKVTNTTKTFIGTIIAIKNKGLTITTPVAGTYVDVEPDIKLQILAPCSASYERLNNYSIVLKLTYGRKSFLFAGDAETLSEREMISKGYNLSADVLKIGHHGSRTSTSSAFLKAVNPKYAVISVWKYNTFGLPSRNIMNKLKSAGVTVYRTDESGTIVCTCDGNTINFNSNPGSYFGRNEK